MKTLFNKKINRVGIADKVLMAVIEIDITKRKFWGRELGSPPSCAFRRTFVKRT